MPYFYAQDFISQDLSLKIASLPKGKWVSLKNRRLQEWGARALPNGTHGLSGLLRIAIGEAFPYIVPVFNQCLINEYKVGQGSRDFMLNDYEDGPCYHPVIATISLGCYTVLDLYQKLDCLSVDPDFSLLLEPNSCLVLSGEYYTDYLHGIKESEYDDLQQANILNITESMISNQRQRENTRISLTFRKHKNVVSKKFFKF